MSIIKIKPLHHKILGIKIAIGFNITTFIAVVIIETMKGEEMSLVPIILWGILVVFLSLVFLQQIQWYYIFDDKIIIKNLFGIVKETYFSDVKQIVQKKLSIFTKDHGVDCYIFIDRFDKKRDRKLLWQNIDNKKNRFARIPITDELQSYIKEKKFSVILK